MSGLEIVGGRNDGPPVTDKQILALNFKAVEEFVHMSEVKRDKRLREMASLALKAAGVAIEILVRDKQALVEMIVENPGAESWYLELHNSAQDVRNFADLIESAVARLLVAMTVVEGDGGPA